MYQISNVWIAEVEFEQMEDYLNFLKQSFADFEQKLENQRTMEELNIITGLGDDIPEDIKQEKYLDIFGSLLGIFPRRLFSSFIVSWYSFMEETLLRLCSDLNIDNMPNPREKGIFLAKKLLKKENIQFGYDDWQELLWINKIRNQIIHEGGAFPIYTEKPENKSLLGPFPFTDENCIDGFFYVELDRDLHKYLNDNELIRIYKKFLIFPTIEYCYHLIEFGKTLLFDIFENCKLL